MSPDPSQVEIVGTTLKKAKTPEELYQDEKRRTDAFGAFMAGLLKHISERIRGGGDGNVTGIVVG